jgi:hypothetical protein
VDIDLSKVSKDMAMCNLTISKEMVSECCTSQNDSIPLDEAVVSPCDSTKRSWSSFTLATLVQVSFSGLWLLSHECAWSRSYLNHVSEVEGMKTQDVEDIDAVRWESV